MASNNPDNKTRTERARVTLAFYKKNLYRNQVKNEIFYEEDYIDLITDLMHLLKASPNKTRAVLTMAQINYEAER